jgi:ABC-type transporter Mla MlaB component
MVDVRVEPRQEVIDVLISGELTVDTVGDISRGFREALEHHRPLVVQVEHVKSFDLSGMQLCLALRRDAATRGITVEFTGADVPDRFRRMLSFAGLPEL